MDEPTIDALAMVRRIREEQSRHLEHATPEEIIRFFDEKSAGLRAELAQRRSAPHAPDAAQADGAGESIPAERHRR